MSELTQAQEVADFLRGAVLNCRTALVLGDMAALRSPDQLSVRLGVGLVDCALLRLSEVESPGPVASLDRDAAISLLDSACALPEQKSVLLVLNWDLMLARLTYEDRQIAWRFVWSSFKRRQKGLMLLLPRNANLLLPSAQALNEWRRARRLAEV